MSVALSALRLPEILGPYPPHTIPASDKTPPAILGPQLHPQLTDRPATVNLDRCPQAVLGRFFLSEKYGQE